MPQLSQKPFLLIRTHAGVVVSRERRKLFTAQVTRNRTLDKHAVIKISWISVTFSPKPQYNKYDQKRRSPDIVGLGFIHTGIGYFIQYKTTSKVIIINCSHNSVSVEGITALLLPSVLVPGLAHSAKNRAVLTLFSGTDCPLLVSEWFVILQNKLQQCWNLDLNVR